MSQEEQENVPAEAATKRRKFKVKFALDGIEDNEEEAFAALQEKRRRTREKQYKLEASVDRNQEDLQDVNNSFFTDVMESLNEQHRDIMHVREAQQDSKVTKKISTVFVKRVQKLDSISRLDWKQFLASIKRKFSEADDSDDDNEGEGDSDGNESSGRKRKAAAHTGRKHDDVDNAAMSWTKLGAAAGRLFLSPVGLESMLGPISKPKVVKNTARQPRKKDKDVKAVVPENIDNRDLSQAVGATATADDDDMNEATYARIFKLDKVVKERSGHGAKSKKKSKDSSSSSSKEDSSQKFPILDVLFDQQDVVQTMENMFDFAFLIKEGDAITQYDSETRVPYAISADKLNTEVVARKQHVLTLSVKEMREIIDYMNEEKAGSISDLFKEHNNGSGSGSESDNDEEGKANDSSATFESNPLHRSDKLYDANSVQQQIQILTQMDVNRKEKRKRYVQSQQAKKTTASQASPSPSPLSPTQQVQPLSQALTKGKKAKT